MVGHIPVCGPLAKFHLWPMNSAKWIVQQLCRPGLGWCHAHAASFGWNKGIGSGLTDFICKYFTLNIVLSSSLGLVNYIKADLTINPMQTLGSRQSIIFKSWKIWLTDIRLDLWEFSHLWSFQISFKLIFMINTLIAWIINSVIQ